MDRDFPEMSYNLRISSKIYDKINIKIAFIR
jgi:hypothetical protein